METDHHFYSSPLFTYRYSEDGANIMIDNGWMEQPPLAADRDELAKRKG
ncbi:DUF3231 family protein [Rossellomorea sp. BNER]